jgi:hypothetical protein
VVARRARKVRGGKQIVWGHGTQFSHEACRTAAEKTEKAILVAGCGTILGYAAVFDLPLGRVLGKAPDRWAYRKLARPTGGSRNLQNLGDLNPVFRSIDPQHPCLLLCLLERAWANDNLVPAFRAGEHAPAQLPSSIAHPQPENTLSIFRMIRSAHFCAAAATSDSVRGLDSVG